NAMPALAREAVRGGLLRYSKWDGLLIILAILHGLLLLKFPTAALIALGLWWDSNTISHNFVHKPFFRAKRLNLLFSLYLSVLLGIPQSLWRARHLAHHADVPWRLKATMQLAVESTLVGALWLVLIVLNRHFFFLVYLPGYVAGLLLCQLHGYYEH